MSAHQLAFLVLGVLILVSALMVVTVRNLVHAALFLILCFAGVAGLYVLLQAEFLAVAQVLIYIGAITVLILFGIMLTRKITGGAQPPWPRTGRRRARGPARFCCCCCTWR